MTQTEVHDNISNKTARRARIPTARLLVEPQNPNANSCWPAESRECTQQIGADRSSIFRVIVCKQ